MNKEITQENTTIKVTKDTRTDLMLFKIYTKAKNMDETIQELLTLAKKRTSPNSETVGDVFNTLYKKREVKKWLKK